MAHAAWIKHSSSVVGVEVAQVEVLLDRVRKQKPSLKFEKKQLNTIYKNHLRVCKAKHILEKLNTKIENTTNKVDRSQLETTQAANYSELTKGMDALRKSLSLKMSELQILLKQEEEVLFDSPASAVTAEEVANEILEDL